MLAAAAAAALEQAKSKLAAVQLVVYVDLKCSTEEAAEAEIEMEKPSKCGTIPLIGN